MDILSLLFGGRREPVAEDILRAAEWAVDQVEPMLKQLGSYPGRYLEPVAHALAYSRALSARVPGPVALGGKSPVAYPAAHTMLPLRGELHAAFESSRAMAEFMRRHPGADAIYVLACMRRNIKGMFGMEMRGEVLRRDVRQEVVYFSDFTLAEPGLTEAECRERIARGFFESLVRHVGNRIAARKQAYERQETERDEWLARLRAAEPGQRAEIQAGLDAVLRRMGEMVRDLELERYHADFESVLLQPEAHVYLEQTEMSLDSMGVVCRPGDSDGEETTFCDLVGRDRRRWTVALVYCNQVKSQATITDNLEKAQRWLGF